MNFITLWTTVSLYISLALQICRIFRYLVVIFWHHFSIIGSKMKHHTISQMSPWLLWSPMMPYLASWFQNAASWDISDVTLASLISHDATFSIFRSKIRHHEGRGMSSFWHLLSLMLSVFGEFLALFWHLKIQK